MKFVTLTAGKHLADAIRSILNRVQTLEDKVRHLQNVYERMAKLEQNSRYGKSGGYPVACICGSMRYKEEMITYAAWLTERRYIVLMPFSVEKAENIKAMLDDMHRQKIDMAQIVYVVGSHIGESTRDEIDYAGMHGKPVTHVHESDVRRMSGLSE